ncbi:MarR family winged helix-turn-helix transcriptional regulator [Undibacterium luofuense]|uniref:MarR family transcriptional regulator n=1 Tax=Undibacterium luofuense TaxID=2828733 RepID=A0A941DJP5_9BURK|nr:MarR family transcriptional regulator [Undibacterium luofuense]MBR7782038.1 MarR family transcriptional regulator [Undibacterium luofuense]
MQQAPKPLEFDVTQVENSVGYLLARSRTMLSRSVDQALSRAGITHAQGSIMITLSMHENVTAATMARDLFIDPAALKRSLDKLEEKGLVRRVADPADRRTLKLELTEAGREVAISLPPLYREVLDVALDGFTQEELGFLKCLLRKLLANRPLLDAKDFSCQGNENPSNE